MKISIVIPVYNEGDRLAACLSAIARQTKQPYEVIVVDNNSTDQTVAVAASYPFVTLLRERRQGVVYARDRGFNAASGDIIGRLDGDTILDTDWLAMVEQIFTEQPDLAAVSGRAKYRGMALAKIVDRCDLIIRRRLARLMGSDVALQGANLALRRSAWQRVRHDLCRVNGMHEDFDLAIHLNKAGYTNAFDERMKATLDFQRVNMGWLGFCHYIWLSPYSYSRHHLKSQRHMYPIVIFLTLAYFPLRLLHRAYDPATGVSSWQLLLNPAPKMPVRVNPALFVD